MTKYDLSGLGFEASYPHVSPQLLARTSQLWSSRGVDIGTVWLKAVRSLKGYLPPRAIHPVDTTVAADIFFMFDQAVVWVSALEAVAYTAKGRTDTELTQQQWLAVHSVLKRLVQKLSAIRMLHLSDLMLPAMQVARSVSEDADMIVLFMIRRKLAARFVTCETTEEASGFWRKHISGGRAFRVVTEQLYRAGLEFDTDGAYAQWRKHALGVLGTAVHTSFGPAEDAASASPDAADQCLYFVTLRIQEIFAYAHIVSEQLQSDLDLLAAAPYPGRDGDLIKAASASRDLVLEQFKWMMAIEPATPR